LLIKELLNSISTEGPGFRNGIKYWKEKYVFMIWFLNGAPSPYFFFFSSFFSAFFSAFFSGFLDMWFT
jgi:hypothetical protein